MPLTQAAIEIMLISLSIGILNSILRRILITKEDVRNMQEAAEYRRELMKAAKEKDVKTLQKLEKRKEYIQKIEAKTFGKNMLIMMASLAIFFIFYYWAMSRYGMGPILQLPPGLYIPLIVVDGKINFFGWYFLTALTFGLPINKFLSPKTPSVLGEMGGAKEISKDKEAKKS
ncbi:MAG: EMC3/TMCO1 family protein [Nitrososphaerota archaeon]